MSRSAASIDEVIVDPKPPTRQRRASEEMQALLGLSETLAQAPERAVQRLVDTAMKLTGAGSAGLSLEDPGEGPRVFRWVAVAGEFSRNLHATMPRDFSPCGTVVDRGRTLVMRDPVRHFRYAADFHVPLHSVLLTPFGRSGRLVGTVWAVSHDPAFDFSTDDVRIVEQLTTFSTSLLDALQGRRRQGARPPGP